MISLHRFECLFKQNDEDSIENKFFFQIPQPVFDQNSLKNIYLSKI